MLTIIEYCICMADIFFSIGIILGDSKYFQASVKYLIFGLCPQICSRCLVSILVILCVDFKYKDL